MASSMPMSKQTLFTHSEKEDYQKWRLELACGRLRIAFWLAILGNPTYIALDYLLYPAHAAHFLMLRGVAELVEIAGLLLTYTRPTENRQFAQLLIFVWGICFPVVHMTTDIGGFRSTYYAGLTLLIFGAAVLVPLRWRQHVLSQAGVLFYYYAINILVGANKGDLGPAIENTYFIVWTCILSTVSVMFYERLLRGEFHARSQLEASNLKLLELDRLKTQFFANISHELRSPLTLIIGAFRNLLNSGLAVDALALIRAGLRNSVNLLYLINELLDLARFESGRMQAEMRPLDIASLVRQIGANFEHSVRQRIHLHGVTDVQAVQGDRKLLKKVIYNLLANAIKFSDANSGEVWVRVRTSADSVVIEVEDNGIGIAQENLSRIFNRFTQVEGSTTRRYEGSGIGLALAKEITTQHGGSISVESTLGEGSTFSVTLPRSDLPSGELENEEEDMLFPAPPGQAREEAHEDHALSHTGALILVADDNQDMRQYLRRILEPHFRVLLAGNGSEALELARAHNPELVLTDIMMPSASGFDLLANLRKEKTLCEVPVVFISALSASESRIAALETGVDDIISKPFDELELVVRLRNVLGARRQQRQVAQLRLERLRRFLPSAVATALIEKGSDEALRSHRAEVTVVFFDLRGFTAFSEEAEPEELMEMLGDYQTRIGALVDQYGGTLEHFSGDAIMVFFNDPLPVPDHMERAIRMAVAARAVLPAFEERWRKRGFKLGVGVGAAIGYATMGMIGYERRQDYAAIGSVTILAARLCEQAESGQILISERLANMIEKIATLTAINGLQLHGIRAPVNAYNVIDVRPDDAKYEAAKQTSTT